MASKQKKDKITDAGKNLDLIEDITVEQLHKDGLVEEVEVSGEASKKKDDPETATDAVKANAATKAAVDSSAPADAGKDEHKGTPPGAAGTQAPEEVNKAQAAQVAAVAATPTAEVPKTKAGLINAMYQQLSSMKTEQLANVYSTLVNPALPPKAEEPAPKQTGDNSTDKDGVKEDADKKDNEDLNPEDVPASDATAPAKDDGESGDDQDDADDDEEEKKDGEDQKNESLEILMQAEKSLSEGFRTKAASLFEATVSARVAEQIKVIEENYKNQLAEETESLTKSLTEKVESYMDYVAKTWMEENQVAIERGLRTEIAENFINALQGVFKESYISVPEGKENLVDTLNSEVAKLEEQLLKATEANIKLNENVSALKRAQIIAEASSDLASTEAVKLNSLVEEIDFEDAESFTKKVATIKESYFRKSVTAKSQQEPEAVTTTETGSGTIVEDVSSGETDLNPVMAAYSSAISRTVKSA